MCPVILNLPFKYQAHWKQQGITYLQYLGLNTNALRGCLKVHFNNLLIPALRYEHFSGEDCIFIDSTSQLVRYSFFRNLKHLETIFTFSGTFGGKGCHSNNYEL